MNLETGYRHLPLRSMSNQPLELSTLFIYSYLDEDIPVDNIPSPVTIPPMEDRQNGRKVIRGVLVKTKDVGDRGKMEKEVGIGCVFFRQTKLTLSLFLQISRCRHLFFTYTYIPAYLYVVHYLLLMLF